MPKYHNALVIVEHDKNCVKDYMSELTTLLKKHYITVLTDKDIDKNKDILGFEADLIITDHTVDYDHSDKDLVNAIIYTVKECGEKVPFLMVTTNELSHDIACIRILNKDVDPQVLIKTINEIINRTEKTKVSDALDKLNEVHTAITDLVKSYSK